MKWAAIALAILVVTLLSPSHLQDRSLWRAGILYSRLELRRALKDIQETGGLRDYGNSLHPCNFTNTATAGGTNYQCAVAYEDPKFYGDGFLAATTNHVFIYFDKKRGPRLIPPEEQP